MQRYWDVFPPAKAQSAPLCTTVTTDAKNQISKLTAAVAELQEAKIQYEFLLRELRERVKTLNEDNKELKQANIALRVASAELKVKPAEYQKTIADLQQKNENLRNLNKTSAEQNIKLTEKTKADAKKIENLCKEIDAANLLVQRYRKELNEWGEGQWLGRRREGRRGWR